MFNINEPPAGCRVDAQEALDRGLGSVEEDLLADLESLAVLKHLQKVVDKAQQALQTRILLQGMDEEGAMLEHCGYIFKRGERVTYTYSEEVDKLAAELSQLKKFESQAGTAEIKSSTVYITVSGVKQ